jgi:hypothetical protein
MAGKQRVSAPEEDPLLWLEGIDANGFGIEHKKTNGRESRCREAVAPRPFEEAIRVLVSDCRISNVAQTAIILCKSSGRHTTKYLACG